MRPALLGYMTCGDPGRGGVCWGRGTRAVEGRNSGDEPVCLWLEDRTSRALFGVVFALFLPMGAEHGTGMTAP